MHLQLRVRRRLTPEHMHDSEVSCCHGAPETTVLARSIPQGASRQIDSREARRAREEKRRADEGDEETGGSSVTSHGRRLRSPTNAGMMRT